VFIHLGLVLRCLLKCPITVGVKEVADFETLKLPKQQQDRKRFADSETA
jgi:hypothetical protein